MTNPKSTRSRVIPQVNVAIAKADEMQTITEDLITRGRSVAGGWTRAQLSLLGVPWPPVEGRKATILGHPGLG